jgi:hypothetical protein
MQRARHTLLSLQSAQQLQQRAKAVNTAAVETVGIEAQWELPPGATVKALLCPQLRHGSSWL